MAERFDTYEKAVKEARKKANDLGLDIAIRKTKEFGKSGFNVSIASRNDSDYARAEIVKPEKKGHFSKSTANMTAKETEEHLVSILPPWRKV